MTDNTKPNVARTNRARIEWMQVLQPLEYVLLDKMLFQSNLTYANNGRGFYFHIRKLAEETGISQGKVSQIIASWPFIKKHGATSAMTIQLDYTAFETWIAHRTNNDCSRYEPRNNNKNDSDSVVHLPNNQSKVRVEPSEATATTGINAPKPVPSVEKQNHNTPSAAKALPVVNVALPVLTESQNPIVHQMSNDASRYVPILVEPLVMPSHIKRGPSAARQSEILRQLKAGGFSFVRDTAMGVERDGFKFSAIDDVQKIILITADDKDYLLNPKVQAMCKHFRELKYDVMLWTEQDQHVFRVVKKNPVASTAIQRPLSAGTITAIRPTEYSSHTGNLQTRTAGSPEEAKATEWRAAFADLEQAFQRQKPNPLMKEIKSQFVTEPSRSAIIGEDDLSGFNPDA